MCRPYPVNFTKMISGKINMSERWIDIFQIMKLADNLSCYSLRTKSKHAEGSISFS